MRIPAPDEFRRPFGDDDRLLWHAQAFTSDGTEFDLYVPGENNWNEAPDVPSIHLAEQLLPDLPAIIAQAAEYVLSIVDVQRRPLFGEPELVVFSCDATRQRVIVELNWETMLDALWYVEMHLHPTLGRRPVGMGVTPWAKHGSPWPPLHVQLEIPRQRRGEGGSQG